jgi:DNA-binding NarL/FixJ family response regulator
MLRTLLVEDNDALRNALYIGLEATAEVTVVAAVASGEEAIAYCLETTAQASEDAMDLGSMPSVVLMDVRLAGEMSGIEAAVALRREYPRLPVVFYSIQDQDAYYRHFLRSGILSHYAYVRKSNYLLPASIVPLLRDAVAGRGYIDPEIEARVHEVRHRDENDPLSLLEPHEREVALLVAKGLTNAQIAERLGYRDRRAASRTNGQIYAAWGLNETTTDEKVARTRAAIIVREGRLLVWAADGAMMAMDERGEWVAWVSSSYVSPACEGRER